MVIRDAVESDAAELAQLKADVTASTPYLLESISEIRLDIEAALTQIRHLTSGSGQYLIVAEDAGSLVGLLSFGRLGFKKIKHRGGLMMMVRPESRGRGVGHRLLASLLDRAKADPTLERLDLSVMASNHLAIRLYERAGFAYEGRRPRAYRLDDGTFEDEVFMGLVLRR